MLEQTKMCMGEVLKLGKEAQTNKDVHGRRAEVRERNSNKQIRETSSESVDSETGLAVIHHISINIKQTTIHSLLSPSR